MKISYLNKEIKNKYINDIKYNSEAFIDQGIKDYINKLNDIPCVCTTQCCEGHPNDGYVSIMITKEKSDNFENNIIPAVNNYCEDIIKRFEQMYDDEIIVRYLFQFKNKDIFFDIFIKELSQSL